MYLFSGLRHQLPGIDWIFSVYYKEMASYWHRLFTLKKVLLKIFGYGNYENFHYLYLPVLKCKERPESATMTLEKLHTVPFKSQWKYVHVLENYQREQESSEKLEKIFKSLEIICGFE